jgi:SAM-dependent methyltransferase
MDYSRVVGVTRVGIDLDPETLAQAAQLARERGLKSEFIQQDAWEIKSDQQFDLIASSGLTIYIRDDERVRNLYRIFFRALKPGGILVTSFLTPPPVPNEQTEWDLSKVDQDAALLQKILFVDILDAGWRAYRPEATVVDQLKSTGFVDLQVIYDQAHIFPTVIARRPSV